MTDINREAWYAVRKERKSVAGFSEQQVNTDVVDGAIGESLLKS
jgi:hypothetical protein